MLKIFTMLLALTLSWVAHAEESENIDPLEPINRGIFGFNDAIDTMFLNPLGQAYGYIIPKPIINRVDDEINFLSEPRNLLNSAITGNNNDFATTTGRILINAIWGLGGLFDVATEAGISRTNHDFGDSLKFYGISSGPYLVLPILGPSSFRDTIGWSGDLLGNPFTYAFNDDVSYAIMGTTLVHNKYKYYNVSQEIQESSLDSYAAFRSIYFQKRGH